MSLSMETSGYSCTPTSKTQRNQNLQPGVAIGVRGQCAILECPYARTGTVLAVLIDRYSVSFYVDLV